MILYIFNNHFPNNAGFGKRCMKEIKILSQADDVIVLCKQKDQEAKNEVIMMNNKKTRIVRYSTFLKSNEKISSYERKKGWYEIVRNIDLTLGMIFQLVRIFWEQRKEKLRIYAVVSPLTVPLIAFIVGKLFHATPHVVEFHDLEPELAMHIKTLKETNFVMKVEYYLEKLMCKLYNKVIVTTEAQARIISNRTGVKQEKILVIPNAIQVENYQYLQNDNKHVFTVGYVSSFTFSYSIKVLEEIINYSLTKKDLFKNITFMIVGDGVLLNELKDAVKLHNVADSFIFTGNRTDVSTLITQFDATIIPWSEDTMTKTMVPTKLFEYMAAKKPIIAPNFGEFTHILEHQYDALLYRSTKELIQYIDNLAGNIELRQQLGTHAYKKFERYFHPDILAKKLVTFINE